MEKVGVFIAQGPPVPIPNTEVKLCGAEDTCLATNRENRSMPTFFHIIIHLTYSSLAQLAEHLTVHQVVAGSSPAGGANNRKSRTQGSAFFVIRPTALVVPIFL